MKALSILRHHDSTVAYSPRLSCSESSDAIFDLWLLFLKPECFKVRGRHTSANQAHIFWAIWSDVLCPTTALLVKFIQCSVIGVLLLKAHFWNDHRCLYKSDLWCSSDSCNLTAGGMICEMEWNRLSRTSIVAAGIWENPDDNESHYSHLRCLSTKINQQTFLDE